MDIFGQIPAQLILFFILYGVTGVVPLIAVVYLLLRRGNAFAPNITPPVRLRRWAAAFFALAALGHVWWFLFYVYSRDLLFLSAVVPSAGYVVVVVLDCVTLLITIAGTLLAMLQDRNRSIWPVVVAMIPFVALGGVLLVYPRHQIMLIAIVYVLLLYILFTIYMVFAVRRYGRWLNDNYADLEHKKVWLSQMVTLGCMLLFILYVLVANIVLIYFLHITELVLFGLLLWRVETLPTLIPNPSPDGERIRVQKQAEELSAPLPTREEKGGESLVNTSDLDYISGLLQQHCVATQLYLQHDLTLHQLAQAIGTNRSYLSQYFSRQGITYNAYINNLRINHFISRCQEEAQTGKSVTVQQLASESGYRCYSTFSLAFKQRMGQRVTVWMRDVVG